MFGPEFPVVDTDPTFSRVMRYMRTSDLGLWAGTTAAFPALMYAWERIDVSGPTARQLRSGLRVSGTLGFCAGFLLAYQNTSMRFWGWKENAREIAKDKEEMTGRVQRGLPVYGESELTPYMQGVAARNSTFAAVNFSTMPWFNLANHPYHGVDTAAAYGEKKPELQ